MERERVTMKTLGLLCLLALVLIGAWTTRGARQPAGQASDGELVVLATHGSRTIPSFLAIHRDSNGHFTTSTRGLGDGIQHSTSSTVRGAVVGSDQVLIIAQQADEGDPSFASDLWRVSAAGERRLLGEVAVASRPLVVGRCAYVQRGRAGAPDGVHVRDDDLVITEIDLDRETTRTVARLHGQLAFPIGVDDDVGLVAYLIGGPDTIGAGGRLVTFSLDHHATRDLGAIGTARDFSLIPIAVVEGKPIGPAIVYEAIRPHARTVEILSLGGSPMLWHRGDTTPLSPLVLPGGQLQVTQRLGDGTLDVPRGYSRSLHALLVSRYARDGTGSRLVLRATDGTAELALDALASTTARLEPVGFVETP